MSIQSRSLLIIRIAAIAIIFVSVVGCRAKNNHPHSYEDEFDSDDRAEQHQVDPSVTAPLHTVTGFRAVRADSMQSEMAHLDPTVDEWDTEAFHEQASNRLKKLAAILRKDIAPDARKVDAFAGENFVSSELRPADLEQVYRGRLYSVVRYSPSDASRGTLDPSGRGSLSNVLRQLRSVVGNTKPLDFHFKIIRVEPSENRYETSVFVELETSTDERIVQQSALWKCDWSLGATPRLLSIDVKQFEEVGTAGKIFNDDTATILGGNSSYARQLVFGSDHWRQRLDWRFGMEIAGPHGLAVADVNDDGLDDLFYCETGGLPNRLYMQLSDGTAEDRSKTSGLDFLEPTQSALFVDLDNDGDQDAALATGRFVLFLENDGSGRFTRRAIHSASSMIRSMACADFDLDNDLDIYVCGYFSRTSIGEGVGLGRPMPYHDANNGVANYLLSNDGDWNFEDVTQAVGLDVNNRRFSFAASWEDYDNDGDADLYVANDFGRNNLYRNDGGRFVDVAATAGVEDMSAGMSVSWSDFDRDGQVDLYIGNMFSSAGNRITYQRRFREADEGEDRTSFQRHARGNTMFRNLGDGSFEDVTLDTNVAMGRWSWSSNFLDFNNDGWDDLLVANGMVTSADDPNDL